jgi:hypothetical protein
MRIYAKDIKPGMFVLLPSGKEKVKEVTLDDDNWVRIVTKSKSRETYAFYTYVEVESE